MTHTIRARLLGLTATLTILAVLIGIPATLVAIGANPVPDHVPTLDEAVTALTSRDDGTLTLQVLTVVAWLAWAFLAATLALELLSRVRGVTAPHLPGLTLPQTAARGLVGAAVLLFVAGPTVGLPTVTAAPAAAAAPAWTASPAATHPSTANLHQEATPHPARSTVARAQADPGRTHTVSRGESLWSIATTELSDGHRWAEVADLNPGVNGPDWVIHPGTVLHLPPHTQNAAGTTASPTNAQTYTVQTGDTLSHIAQDRLGDPDRYPDIVEASRHTRQTDGRHLRDPDRIYPGWHLTIPGTSAGAPAAPARTATETPPLGVPDAPQTGTPGTGAKPADPSPLASAAPGSRSIPSVNGPGAPAPSASAASSRTHPPAGDPSDTATRTAPDEGTQTAAPWVLAGLVGGPVLAGSMWMLLRQRRAVQLRHRRPGRTIATPPPVLAPVEKTLATIASTTQPTVEFVDAVLRRLASARAHAGLPMPCVAAVEIGRHDLTLHLDAPAQLASPWTDLGNQARWSLPSGTDPADLGDLTPDQPAPYPLLVTIGTSDSGHVWLLNCEDLTITLTGEATYRDDFARYLAAEIACNPWSAWVTLDCVGIAAEVAALNPDRIRPHTTGTDPAAEVLAHAVNTIDRAHDHHNDVATARAHLAGADSWAPRMLLLDATAEPTPALTQLLHLVDQHRSATGTSVVYGGALDTPGAVVVELTSTGRVRLPHAGLDLVAVGLTRDEAQGCAALLAAGADFDDTPVPIEETATTGWRSYTDAAGALRRQHTVPRQTPDKHILVATTSVLPDPDQDYVATAATTTEDLAALAPKVPTTVRDALHDADPTLDADVAAWFADDCPLPRLTLLGPVRARTRGTPLAVRKAYMTGVLTYLSTRSHGATPDELADALSITPAKARGYAKTVRDWLGTNPRTGQPHLPDARRTPEAKSRGVAIYQVQDLLVDADLFRRLRARGQACGQHGITDLTQALDFVQGPPFSQLSGDAWAWLYEGDRLDHHLSCAVVDVAHLVTTHALRHGDTRTARTATETALLAAPAEEIPHLDLAAVTRAEGHPDRAKRILRDQVANRTDDEGPPMDLPARTQTILNARAWTGHDQASGATTLHPPPESPAQARVDPRTGTQ
ncbi:LysM peptidoglycan-binding domain-containing protein [Knoellia aerolata]|uniref:LysM domain-containing protein n=1 Tax=Knoellia aerolata DSM 18566 TaxID=1385519 RepID=A0A0A0JV57_9MICO|nr:LysM peptidoglycan-binding domain-containing protein [Knoellia aerolata]KGN41043.1 hypothetical protein N801_09690 [Knoellia aerolata DSM 18566]